MLKITLNKPAYRTYLEGQNAKGLEIKISEEGTVAFRPTRARSGHNIVRIDPGTRGGVALYFDGAVTEPIMLALTNPYHNSYFLLSRVGEWVIATPYRDENGEDSPKAAPPHSVPSLRVWPDAEMLMSVRKVQTKMAKRGDEPKWASTLSAALAEIKAAYKIVNSYDTTTIGRPPDTVVAAKQKLIRFELVAQEVLPIYKRTRAIHEQFGKILDATFKDDLKIEVSEAAVFEERAKADNTITKSATTTQASAVLEPKASPKSGLKLKVQKYLQVETMQKPTRPMVPISVHQRVDPAPGVSVRLKKQYKWGKNKKR